MGIKIGNLTGETAPVNLNDLHDVSIVSPQSGQYLRYNGSTTNWQNSFLNTDVYEFLTSALTGSSNIILSDLSGPQEIIIDLANTAATPGTYGSPTQIPMLTVDSKGRVTAISNVNASDITLIGITNNDITAVGVNSLVSNTTGVNNTAVGIQSLQTNTTGGFNSAIGPHSLQTNTTGFGNTAIGPYSLQTNTTGDTNTAIAPGACRYNISGSQNVAVGVNALQNNIVGTANIAIGYHSLNNTTGTANIAIGNNSGYAITTGNYNVILGGSTGTAITTLSNHIIISDGEGNERIQIDNTGAVTIPGSLTVVGTLSATISGTSTSAVNILNGTAGAIPFQTTASATSFLPAGNSTEVLISGASPSWTNAPALTGTNFVSIPNTGLINDSLTIGSTSIALGATSTTLAGLTSVTSTGFTGELTGAASANVLKAGDTMTGLLILSGDPVNALDAVTKQYADGIASGVNIHASCETSTTIALPACTYNNGTSGVGATLTANANGAIGTIGGNSNLAVSSRVLIKDQGSTLQNGIYSVTQLGDAGTPWILTRATDFDGSPTAEVSAGDLTYIQGGTIAGTQWVETATGSGMPGDYIVIGIDPIVFSQFSGAGTYSAGAGINIATNIISNTGVTSAVAGSNISVSGATGAVTIAVTGTVPTATTSTNISGGAAGYIPYQSSAGVTSLLATSSGVLIGGLTPSYTISPTLTGTNFTGIPNAGLVNNSLTIGTTSITLGSTALDLTGINSISATSFNATSTARVKNNIVDLGTEYLNRFKNLRPCEYDRKDYVAHEFGFIAEEMALIYPEVVGIDASGRPGGIDYGKLSTILTAKIQAQESTINKLQDQMMMVLELLKGMK